MDAGDGRVGISAAKEGRPGHSGDTCRRDLSDSTRLPRGRGDSLDEANRFRPVDGNRQTLCLIERNLWSGIARLQLKNEGGRVHAVLCKAAPHLR